MTRGGFASTLWAIELDDGGGVWNAGGYLAGIAHGVYAFQFSPSLGGGYGELFAPLLWGNDPFGVLRSSTVFLVNTQNRAASTADFTSFSDTWDSSAGWIMCLQCQSHRARCVCEVSREVSGPARESCIAVSVRRYPGRSGVLRDYGHCLPILRGRSDGRVC